MKRLLTTLAFAAAVLAASAAGTPAVAQGNLLANPGFEDGGGSYAGWFTFGSGVQVSTPATDNIFRSGAAASKIYGGFVNCPGGSFNVGGYGQSFTPQAGKLYQFSGWSFISNADPIPGTDTCNRNRVIAKIVFFDSPAGGQEVSSSEVVIGDGNTVTEQWNSFTVSAPVPAGALRVEALILFLQPACETGSVFVDDVALTATTPDAEINALVNPSFSTGLTGWNTFGNVFFDARPTLVRTPTGCAKMFSTFVQDAPSGLYQSFPAVEGQIWKFSTHAMTTCREDPITGTNDNFVLARIVFRDGGGNEVGSLDQRILDNTASLGKWTRNELVATAPAGTAQAQCYALFISPTLQGGAMFLDDLSFGIIGGWVDVAASPGAGSIELHPNVPNPFRPMTRIAFTLPRREAVDAGIFDVAGRRIATLFQGEREAGRSELTWNGRTNDGTRAPAGVYWCVVRTANDRVSRSMVLSE